MESRGIVNIIMCSWFVLRYFFYGDRVGDCHTLLESVCERERMCERMSTCVLNIFDLNKVYCFK